MVGEGERLRLVFVGGEVGAGKEEEEVVDRLVFAVEGVWAEAAWRVSLESLAGWVGFWVGVEVLVVVDFVGFGGLEKSISSDSLLSEELVGEDEGSAFAAFGIAGFLVVSLMEPLSDDEVSEDVEAAFAVATAGLEASGLDTLSEEGLLGDVADFGESELDEAEDLSFRFIFFGVPFTTGFWDDLWVSILAPVDSFSSSASLSELEVDVVDEGDFVLDVLEGLGAVLSSFISTSESLSSPLSPLLLVSFLATSAAAFSSAFACFLDFLDVLAALVSESSSLLLLLALLVSSICVLSLYSLCHSLKTLTRSGKPLGNFTSSCAFHSSSLFRDFNWVE